MKLYKHIAIDLCTIAGVMALCSAARQSTIEDKLARTLQAPLTSKELPSVDNMAFKEGEVLSYRLHYGFIDAGVAVLEVKPQVLDVSGRKVYHIVGNGYSKGTFDWFFKVRDRYETYIDKSAMLPWLFVRRVEEGGYKINQDYIFNQYINKVDVGNGEKIDIPAGTQDMISSFYAARNMDFSNARINDIFTINSFIDKELWPLKIRYVGKETIETDLGKFSCLKFRPIVQKGRVFKNEEDLNVWITDDKNHVPLRAQAKLMIGSVKLDIVDAKNLANPTSKVE